MLGSFDSLKNVAPKGLVDLVQGVDHVAVAVRDLEAAVAWYSEMLGFGVVERRVTHGQSTAMISAVLNAGETPIVLLQGTSEGSQVNRFIARFGPGVHHFALRVRDLDTALRRLRPSGVRIDVEPIVDGGIKQTFLARSEATGMRLELVERSAAGFSDNIVELVFREFESKELV